jgi:putative phosphoesterase
MREKSHASADTGRGLQSGHARFEPPGSPPVRLGIVSDIHCNIGGLRAALAVMGPIDELLCLGDCVDRNRFSNDVVRLLRDVGAHVILGNHDEAFLAEISRGTGDCTEAEPDLVAWLAARPPRRRLTYGPRTVLMVHSTPWEPRGAYIFPHNEKLALFADAGADFVLYGHTHAPVVTRFGEVVVVNPGTAGDGRESSEGWHLSCAVLNTATGDARIIPYMDPRSSLMG